MKKKNPKFRPLDNSTIGLAYNHAKHFAFWVSETGIFKQIIITGLIGSFLNEKNWSATSQQDWFYMNGKTESFNNRELQPRITILGVLPFSTSIKSCQYLSEFKNYGRPNGLPVPYGVNGIPWQNLWIKYLNSEGSKKIFDWLAFALAPFELDLILIPEVITDDFVSKYSQAQTTSPNWQEIMSNMHVYDHTTGLLNPINDLCKEGLNVFQ